MSTINWRISGLAVFLSTCSLPQASTAQPFPTPIGEAIYCRVPSYAAPNPQIASATVINGKPAIVVDPSFTHNNCASHFFAAHECGHHVVGHVTPEGMWWRSVNYWATTTQELQADCWAAQRIPPHCVQEIAHWFANQGHLRPGNYPSGVERAQNILQCAGF